MRKQKLLAGLLLGTILLSGCTQKTVGTTIASDSNAAEISAEEASKAEKEIVKEFENNENPKYTLEIDGEPHDITDYVTGYQNGTCSFRSDILVDIFGFEKYDRGDTSEEKEFLEYKKDDDLLQLSINGQYVIYNGEVGRVKEPMTKLDGTDEITLTPDFVLSLGKYNSYTTSTDGDTLIISVHSPEVEGETMPSSTEETTIVETELSTEIEETAEILEISEKSNSDLSNHEAELETEGGTENADQ